MVCIDDEIPFEIPQGWVWVRFSQLYWQLTDGAHLTPKYTENGIPFISVKDMSSGEISFSNTKFISIEEHKILSSRCNPQKGDLLLSKVGTTGVPAIVNTDRSFSLFVSVALIKFFPEYINSCFLVYLINSPLVQDQAKENTRGVGNKNWVLTAISSTLMAIPPLSEQKRIVLKINEITPYLKRYEMSQDNLNCLNASVSDRLKKSILQEAIQGKLVPQDPNDEPASMLLERIRIEKQKLLKEGKLKKKDVLDSVIFHSDDNKYYEKVNGEDIDISDKIPFNIPDSWSWTRLGFITSNEAGLSYNKEFLNDKTPPFIRVLRGGNIEEGRWFTQEDDVKISHKFVKESLLLKKGTFITPAVTSIERMAKTALVEVDQDDTVVGGFVLMIKPFVLTTTFLQYLNLFFQTTYYKQYCIGITNKSGQAFYNLSRQKLMQCLVPIPPLEEQRRIVKSILYCLNDVNSKGDLTH